MLVNLKNAGGGYKSPKWIFNNTNFGTGYYDVENGTWVDKGSTRNYEDDYVKITYNTSGYNHFVIVIKQSFLGDFISNTSGHIAVVMKKKFVAGETLEYGSSNAVFSRY